jgi:DNA repair and recombination RAD54-like protein
MGLGKTLQSIALIWLLTRQSPHGGRDVEKAVVVVPSSLLGQWQQEIKKFLSFRLSFMAVDSNLGMALGRGNAKEQVQTFCNSSPEHATVLIISYESYRLQGAYIYIYTHTYVHTHIFT